MADSLPILHNKIANMQAQQDQNDELIATNRNIIAAVSVSDDDQILTLAATNPDMIRFMATSLLHRSIMIQLIRATHPDFSEIETDVPLPPMEEESAPVEQTPRRSLLSWLWLKITRQNE